jgi:DNA (cytosine-5)-methyltransferase 1
MKFASIFSGCGGFDLGFIGRGFRSLGAYDSDRDAVDHFSANINGPIKLVDLTHGVPGYQTLLNIDVLIAGPPCQGFSTAGKRRIDDERNLLLDLTGSLALKISPKVLIIENVPGSLAGEHARYFRGIEEAMRIAGYRTHMLRCQTADFGMAQLRRRILFFAWKTGFDVRFVMPRLPAGNLRTALGGVSRQRNHHPNSLVPNTREWVIAKHILPGQKLCNVRGGGNAVPTWDIPEVFGHITEPERTVLEMLRRLRRSDRRRTYGDADPVSLDRLEAALGARFQTLVDRLLKKGYLRRVGDDIDLVGTFNGTFRRLRWDKPSCTVDTRFGLARYFLHPTKQRGFTVREAARIQGFADSYIFQGNEKAQYRLIGNAVPPPLATFAANITKSLLARS